MLKDPKKTKDEIVQWIRDYFAENGPECSAVIGISGGKDSTVVAALCVEALGKDRVVGVLMPCGIQPDIHDSYKVVTTLDIGYRVVNIGDTVLALTDQLEGIMHVSKQTKVNLPARIRMTTLYAVAQSLTNGGRVVNTCNRSEDYVGYSTKFGDSAGDFSPLANLMVHEVRQIGHELQLPQELVDKTPSDGLCGKTDEDNLGFTYAQLDDYIERGTCGIMSIDYKIESMHKHNLHKLRPMPAFGTDVDGNGEDETEYICPICGKDVDLDDIDLANSEEDGYGKMTAPCVCKNCGANLIANYISDGYRFTEFDWLSFAQRERKNENGS